MPTSFRRSPAVRALLSLAAVLLLTAAAAPAATERWLAYSDLDAAARRQIVRDFHARGTHHGMTLVVADGAERSALAARYGTPIDLGDVSSEERLLFVLTGPDADWRAPAGVRELYRGEEAALVAVGEGVDPHALHVETTSRVFHDGIRPVPNRRQLPVAEFALPQRAAGADPLIQSWVNSVVESNLEDDVTTLSTDFTTRESDSNGGAAAEDWIFDRFVALGYSPTRHSFDGNADNVIAEITGSLEPEKVVVVGAHYDSINLFFGGNAPGADDNASGTSAVLEIARILADANAEFRFTLRFILFASEEYGLIGSDAYSGMLRNQGVDVIAMLNTDMNSYRQGGDALDLDFVNNDTSPSLTQTLRDVSALYVPGLPTRTGNLFAGSSDHAPFHNDGFPAAFYFEDTGDFSPFIHSGDDNVGNSANDFELSQMITKSIVAGAATLAEPIGSLTPPVLAISGSCPGAVTFDVTDASANARVALITGPSTGSALVPGGSCEGTELGLDSPTLRRVLDADGSGAVSLEVDLPSTACSALVQVLDLSSCLGSTVESMP